MASSTQERFRRETLPLSPPARSDSGSPLVVYVPPPAPVALTDLLESFRSALQVADKLSAVLTVRAGDGRLTRHLQVPRLRLFLRYYLNQHISRRLAHLKRAFHADAALGIDRAGELNAIEHFEQAVASVPVRRIFVWFAVSVVFSAVAISNVATALWPAPLSRASEALRGSVESIISVDTNGLINASEKFDVASGVAAVIVISLALYLISALPITSFRLMRMLLNLTPTDEQKLENTSAIYHASRSRGVYRDELAAFSSLGVPAPREIPLDLIAQATLMLLPLLLGVSFAVANLENILGTDGTTSTAVGYLAALAWLFLVIPLGRLAHLFSIWRRRVDDATGADPAQRFTREELGRPAPRLGAFVIDTTLGVVVSFLLLPPVSLARSADVEFTLWWFAAMPLAFAGATIPFMLRKGRRHGQTLGKQLCRLRVVCDNHDEVSAGRATVRELFVKAPFWTGSISLLFLPAVVNCVWSVVDPERRGLQDRATGTRVVRVPRGQ
jgi:uncharacterized RDD family membrane protein YckC